jgi:uncharacterized surface protein with fasciclin (FAS1) repeats
MKSLRRITTAALVLATAGLLVASGMYAAYGSAQGSYMTPDNLFTNAKPAMNDPSMAFTTLRKAIVYAGLQGTLDGAGPATIFAPDDRAFAAIPRDTFNTLFNDKAKLQAVLKYHVILGHAYKVNELPKVGSAQSLQGGTLTFGAQGHVPTGYYNISGNRGVSQPAGGTTYTVNGADIIWSNIAIADGRIVHAIDKVLIPGQ